MEQLTYGDDARLGHLSWPSIPIPQEFPSGKRMTPLRENDVLRFMKLVKPEGSCLRWQGYCGKNGYGYYGLASQVTVLAHRFAYIIWRGPIPDDLPHLDHLCRNRACVDPWSLDPVTRSINLLRSPLVRNPNTANHAGANKTHCKHGHAFDEANTYVDRDGHRHCRACRRAVEQRRRGPVLPPEAKREIALRAAATRRRNAAEAPGVVQ
jgi:hypothetical protein